MSWLAEAPPEEIAAVEAAERSGISMVMTQLRCSECDLAIDGLTEEDAGCVSGEVVCERCMHSRYDYEEEQELPVDSR